MRIPADFELPGEEVIVSRQGGGLLLQPVDKPSLVEILKTLENAEDEFPDIDAGLGPPRDVVL